MFNKRILNIIMLVLFVSIGVTALALQMPRKAAVFSEAYPYASKPFDKFVAESYGYRGSKEWRAFYDYMDRAYVKYHSRFPAWKDADLKGMLDSQKSKIGAISNSSKRAKAELALSSDLHRFVKTAIPTFSLDRGFEFYFTHKRGERQCFLQSILIAGMLQRAGVDAGVAMVYKNIAGEQTNNGHAVDLVRLSNGHDIIVDASEPKPFAKQTGLFVKQETYAYVDPVFAARSNEIVRYKPASGGKAVDRARIKALGYDFLRSQFWYYRGERAIGGLILVPKTESGLKASEQALRTSIKVCPENPLAVFTLGRVYLAEGKTPMAKKAITDARNLYLRFGWLPDGIKEYIALVKP